VLTSVSDFGCSGFDGYVTAPLGDGKEKGP